MKSVCIVTICGGSNFGNRLQNYALQTAIYKRGEVCVHTLKNMAGEIGGHLLRFTFIQKLFASPFSELIARKFLKNGRVLKKIKFARFNLKYIKWSKYVALNKAVNRKITDDYDIFIAGSDQIWNPEIEFNSDVEYLLFAKGKAKIAYAASFGTTNLPNHSDICTKLTDFVAISVREQEGVDILKDYGINNAQVVLDPTMLITGVEWAKLEKAPNFHLPENGYILSYTIWENNKEIKDHLQATSQKTGWEIIDIYNTKDIDHYDIEPIEFLYLIHHAKYIFTDSFHASVFSLLFHKSFSAFIKESMSSRLTTLTKLTATENVLTDWRQGKIPVIDYTKTDRLLEIARKQSLDFLYGAIDASKGDKV